MPINDDFDNLLTPQAIVYDLDGVIIPDDHAVFKLFPGKTYRLAKAMHDAKHAFLDIQGLESLPNSPWEWDDAALLNVISLDRIMREGEKRTSRKSKSGGNSQDKKRLRFLKNLYFEAKLGDLIIVPLGEGFSSQVAIGELQGQPGDLRKISYTIKDEKFETYGRSIKWLTRLYRTQLSPSILKSLHSPTAFHLLNRSWNEEIYVSAYGTFIYGSSYVAKFPSEKEVFSAQDHANIGVLFNGLSVAHDRSLALPETAGQSGPDFFELAVFEESSVTIQLVRNSPISVIVKTVGPLAISAAIMFAAAAEGRTAAEMQNVQVTARRVGDAADRCTMEVPRDVAAAAIGLGMKRYETFCRVRAKVEEEARVKSPARLKSPDRTAR